MILYSEGATKAQEDEANTILEVLTTAYPSHPWGVRVYDGGFFIRHLDFPPDWGMNCNKPTLSYSASAIKRQIIMMAGEWLERANIKRGRGEDAPIGYIEGIPDRFQLPSVKPKVSFEKVVIESSKREEAMPQVIKEANNGN